MKIYLELFHIVYLNHFILNIFNYCFKALEYVLHKLVQKLNLTLILKIKFTFHQA